jgi:DNA-directed RNA polymerase
LASERAQEIFCSTGASFFGIDKVNYRDRIDWVFEHADDIQKCYHDPVGEHWWMEADKPYQFLAFCLEFGAWEEGGNSPDFTSYMVCSFDATSSGIQVMAALGRDSESASLVNLLPSDAPNDIYGGVAERVIEKLEVDVHAKPLVGMTTAEKEQLTKRSHLAAELLKSGLIDRSICKKPTMTKVYASTRWGQAEMLEDYLDDLEENGRDLKLEDVRATVRYLSPVIFDSIDDSVVGATKIMDWFKIIADKAADVHWAIEWVTPVGFKVRQRYMTTSQDTIETMLDGRVRLKCLKETRRMHRGENKAAISANFVHSLDSAHLCLTVDTMTHDMAALDEKASWAVVHDQFGCHAADGERLATTLREQFVELYQMNDPLLTFKDLVAASLQIDLPDPPEQGDLDIRQVLDSAFFFH